MEELECVEASLPTVITSVVFNFQVSNSSWGLVFVKLLFWPILLLYRRFLVPVVMGVPRVHVAASCSCVQIL